MKKTLKCMITIALNWDRLYPHIQVMCNLNFLITVAKVHLYPCTSEYVRVFTNIHIGNKAAPLED